MSARAWCVGMAVLAFACGHDTPSVLPPNGQLLVYVDTDAPLPAPPGETLGPDEPAPLFDRLRLEVYRPGEASPCSDCTHEFDVDRALLANKRASVGITPPVGASGYVVRARLYKASFIEAGEPSPAATLETYASLPPIPAEGVVAVTIPLHTDDVARPVGSLAAPIAPVTGAPQASLVGTWPGARRVPCEGAPRDDETCVPGGAYWMGNLKTRFLTVPGEHTQVRLVTVSPFFLDLTEVTVAAFRASGLVSDKDPIRYDGDGGSPGPRVRCTYSDALSDFDRLPLNCVSWNRAEVFCEQKGGSLPTEAQYQYVASALEGRPFVWGQDLPGCDDAVFSRSRELVAALVRCPGNWLAEPGTGRLDRITLGGRTVVDLAGNVSEHVLDMWQYSTESCWGTGLFHDPVCQTTTSDPLFAGQHARVGGAFTDIAGALAATTRRPTGVAFATAASASGKAGGLYAPLIASTGFRCARPGQ